MYEFKVEGMTCPSCANSISLAMKQVDATSSVKIDINEKLVKVNSRKTSAEIKSVLEEVGFPVLESRQLS